MKKQGLARALAQKTGITRAEAADQVDRLVADILQQLRSGECADMAGIGHFGRDSEGRIHFREENKIKKPAK